MKVQVHKNDLPDDINFSGDLAIDTETTGLNFNRDRLCCVQISDESKQVHIVHFHKPDYSAPNLRRILSNQNREYLFHYARFDVAMIYKCFDIMIENIYCTKIASRVARTYTESHGLKDLCRELLGIQISKQQQSSYWGIDKLSQDQVNYAANDVIHLHELRSILQKMLGNEKRVKLVKDCFKCIPTLVRLDLEGWNGHEIFAVRI